MKPQKIARILVALKLPEGVHHVMAQAKTIVAEIAANPSFFPSPHPPLATVNAHIAAVDAAETVALTRAKGAVQARDAALRVVLDDLLALKAYVQLVANADPANAAAIITAATMNVRKAIVRTKQDLEAKQGAVSGTVRLVAKAAAPRASYEWQTSLDQKTWTDLPDTLQAHTALVDLPLLVTHYFRYRALTKLGKSDWSQIVSLLVT